MANLWCDGFGRYGGDKSKMLNGSSGQAWAQVDAGLSLTTDNPRTGTHCLRLAANSSDEWARRIFGGAKEEVLVGQAWHFEELPYAEPTIGILASPGVCIGSFRTQANLPQISLFVGTDGSIIAYRGGEDPSGEFDATLLGRTIPIIGAGAYQHIEVYLRASNENGALEIRVDEITRLSLTGIDTIPQGAPEVSQWAWGAQGVASISGTVDVADAYANDTVNDGSGCHTFIGDCKSGWLPVNADTAQADFALSAGSDGFALLDDTPPDDATYISTSATTAQSDFGLTNAPANLSEILTVRPAVRAQKDDAGSALIAPSMKSNGVKEAIAGQPITTAFAYYDANVPFNPDTDAPWTLAELDAALHVVERVE